MKTPPKRTPSSHSKNRQRVPQGAPVPAPELDQLLALFKAGRHAEAEAAARGLLERAPRSGVLWKILGAALHLQGKNALDPLQQACQFLPADPEAYNALGLAQHAAGQSEAALASYDKALKLRPGYADACNNAGMTLFDLGRFDEAAVKLRLALTSDPRHVRSHNNLGNVQQRLKQTEEAVASYRRAIELAPQFAEFHNNLGGALHALGRLDEAAASYRQALACRPDNALAFADMAIVQLEQGLLDAALESCRRALALAPRSAKAHSNLGRILHEAGQHAAALDSFAHALELAPEMPEALNSLGNTLRELSRFDQAAGCYRRAIAAQPDYAEAYVNLGLTQHQQGLIGDAEESCRAALQIAPDLAGAVGLAARLAADRGDFAEAEAGYRRAISLDPQNAAAWSGITRVRKMTPDDAAWRTGVEALLARNPAPRQEVFLRYALGKYCDDLGDYDAAFAHYHRANELAKRHTEPYRPDAEEAAVASLAHTYDAAWFARARAGAEASARPVFIIGMPRSGTSLAEQIIASHPSVFGAGELPFWRSAAPAFDAAAPDADAQLAALAQRCLAVLDGFSRDALRVVDKLPGNYTYVGIILAAFPHARFIHMQRNPADTCLSIYFQNFNTGHAYANDLGDLAHCYACYARLMAHWRAVLPAHAMLEVPYEELVREQELWSRRMIEFLGLPWDERCLDFHGSKRTVSTASSWQVRQKMNAGSVARWRRYEAHAGPLLHLL